MKSSTLVGGSGNTNFNTKRKMRIVMKKDHIQDDEQQAFLVLTSGAPTSMVFPSLILAGAGSSEESDFLLIMRYISERMVSKAFSTFVASSADVSMNERPSFSA